jgi:16S rRNA (adenine1518-N6/adenine1519-N6)-dimethyltransferase
MKLTNISTIKDLMNHHGFAFSKSLGQNFLINPSVCPRMAQSLCPQPDSAGFSSPRTVIEIGAGIGVLTRELSKVADKVIVIEIDEKLKPILDETLADCNNVEIIWGDALEIIHTLRFDEPVSVVANLPYYAATHIIMQLLEQTALHICSITVMVQEEVAQRFTASPKSKQYGIVSVAAKLYSTPKLLFKVSRGSFMPAPNVDSAVIQLIPHTPPDLDIKQLFRLIKAAFSERRKQLCNPVSKEFGIGKEIIKQALISAGEKSDEAGSRRAEDLSVEEFIELYENLSNRNVM